MASLLNNNHLWIATASTEAPKPHLVPLSYAWTGSAVIIATALSSTTAINLLASGIARLAVGRTDDVVMIDVTVQSTVAIQRATADIAEVYAGQSDWDPRVGADLPTNYFVLEPTRIQAWREVDEQIGRTLMSNGEWLT